MKNTLSFRSYDRVLALLLVVAIFTLISTRLYADTGSCGGNVVTVPFTDVAGGPFFCAIAEAFFSGITNGTSPTTYSPGANVTRGYRICSGDANGK